MASGGSERIEAFEQVHGLGQFDLVPHLLTDRER